MNSNIRMVQIVAEELEKLKEPFVFVGGAIASLYLTDQAVEKVRATNDVDCVIQVATRADYYQIEQKLRTHGFSNVPGKVICRWNVKGINVDIMPTQKEILGFANNWYKEGIANAIEINFFSGSSIKIFSLPYFIASKLEAFNDRGKSDFYGSHDLEDIISVLDGCESSEQELLESPLSVKKFISSEFKKYMKDNFFLESIKGHLDGPTREERALLLIKIIQKVAISEK